MHDVNSVNLKKGAFDMEIQEIGYFKVNENSAELRQHKNKVEVNPLQHKF